MQSFHMFYAVCFTGFIGASLLLERCWVRQCVDSYRQWLLDGIFELGCLMRRKAWHLESQDTEHEKTELQKKLAAHEAVEKWLLRGSRITWSLGWFTLWPWWNASLSTASHYADGFGMAELFIWLITGAAVTIVYIVASILYELYIYPLLYHRQFVEAGAYNPREHRYTS